jgi:hypothetical protein
MPSRDHPPLRDSRAGLEILGARGFRRGRCRPVRIEAQDGAAITGLANIGIVGIEDAEVDQVDAERRGSIDAIGGPRFQAIEPGCGRTARSEQPEAPGTRNRDASPRRARGPRSDGGMMMDFYAREYWT